MATSLADGREAIKRLTKERDGYKASFQRLKQVEIDGDIQLAAEEDASLLDQYDGGNARGREQFLPSRAGSNGSAGRKQIRELYGLQQGGRNGLHSSRMWKNPYTAPSLTPCPGSAPVPMTPSGHRQRLAPQTTYVNRTTHLPQGYGGMTVDQLHHGTPYRQPLGNIDPNSHLGPTGSNYGMSAGMKVGRQPGGQMGRPGMNNSRPRAGVGLTMR